MASRTVSVEKFERVFCAVLDGWEDEFDEAVHEDFSAAADKALERLRQGGPYEDRSGKYTRGWQKAEHDEAFGGYTVEVGNAKAPGLAHLLEKGHVMHNSGKRARAFPHIAEAALAGAEELRRRLR